MRILSRRFVIGLALATALGGTACAQPLGAYNAKPSETSVSGISSGAYMAVQFGTAWSGTIKGVGAIAGGPYGCSGGMGSTALSTCMVGAPSPDADALFGLAGSLFAKGKIDDPANVARQAVYLFNGYNDTVVNRSVTDGLAALYARRLGAPNAGQLFYQTSIGAGHSQVTSDWGGRCSENGGEFINNCRYDQAGAILRHVYGALNPPNRTGHLNGTIVTFDQAPFTAPAAPADASMGDKGFAYVPADCAVGMACRVHIALHGCKQSFDNIKDDFVRHAGYNEWADTNRIVVLYPQTRPTLFPTKVMWGAMVQNPEACWDWWGYLDTNPMDDPRFLTKDGPQIAAIKKMLDRLTGGLKEPWAIAAPATQVLQAVDATDTAIDLAWSAVPSAQAYEVARKNKQGSFVAIATVPGLSFADKGLTPATTYAYQVRPILPAGPGPTTGPVSRATAARVPPCGTPGTCR